DVVRQFVATVVAKEGFKASWDEHNEVTVLGNRPTSNPTCADDGNTTTDETYPLCTSVRVLLPGSTTTLTVFGTVPADLTGAPIKVYIDDLANGLSSAGVSPPDRPDAIVRLNPNPYHAPTAESFTTEEFHGASVNGPFVQPTQDAPWKTPGPGNPGPGN